MIYCQFIIWIPIEIRMFVDVVFSDPVVIGTQLTRYNSDDVLYIYYSIRSDRLQKNYVVMVGSIEPWQLAPFIEQLMTLSSKPPHKAVLLTTEDVRSFAEVISDVYRKYSIRLSVRKGDAGLGGQLTDVWSLGLRTCAGVYIFSDSKAFNPTVEDHQTIARCIGIGKAIPLSNVTLMLNTAGDKELVMDLGVADCVCLSATKMRFIGKTLSGCPGFITLVSNLCRFEPLWQNSLLNRQASVSQSIIEYMRGAQQSLCQVMLPQCCVGSNFMTVSRRLYKTLTCLLIGLVTDGGVTILNPGLHCRIPPGCYGIFIARDWKICKIVQCLSSLREIPINILRRRFSFANIPATQVRNFPSTPAKWKPTEESSENRLPTTPMCVPAIHDEQSSSDEGSISDSDMDDEVNDPLSIVLSPFTQRSMTFTSSPPTFHPKLDGSQFAYNSGIGKTKGMRRRKIQQRLINDEAPPLAQYDPEVLMVRSNTSSSWGGIGRSEENSSPIDKKPSRRNPHSPKELQETQSTFINLKFRNRRHSVDPPKSIETDRTPWPTKADPDLKQSVGDSSQGVGKQEESNQHGKSLSYEVFSSSEARDIWSSGSPNTENNTAKIPFILVCGWPPEIQPFLDTVTGRLSGGLGSLGVIILSPVVSSDRVKELWDYCRYVLFFQGSALCRRHLRTAGLFECSGISIFSSAPQSLHAVDLKELAVDEAAKLQFSGVSSGADFGGSLKTAASERYYRWMDSDGILAASKIQTMILKQKILDLTANSPRLTLERKLMGFNNSRPRDSRVGDDLIYASNNIPRSIIEEAQFCGLISERSKGFQLPELVLVTELSSSQHLRFLDSSSWTPPTLQWDYEDITKRKDQSMHEKYTDSPEYAAGRVFAPDCLYALAASSSPLCDKAAVSQTVIQKMIGSADVLTETSNKSPHIATEDQTNYDLSPNIDSYFDPLIRYANATHWQKGVELLKVPKGLVGKTYIKLMTSMTSIGRMPIGLYRSPEAWKEVGLPYVYTNPPPLTIVSATDGVYVLQSIT
eukprot:GHVL01042178.1.p1 GENE.GHVL01042178.1~~GHVL01042178.1.p1  ORF type:complete len:1027 (-),score=124.68 GHVL01042178.1:904-3984(-)